MSRLLVTSFASHVDQNAAVFRRGRPAGASSLIERQQQVDRLSVCLNAAPTLPRAFMLSLSLSAGRCQLHSAMPISG